VESIFTVASLFWLLRAQKGPFCYRLLAFCAFAGTKEAFLLPLTCFLRLFGHKRASLLSLACCIVFLLAIISTVFQHHKKDKA
jgi:hypothetical protein